MIIIIPAYQPNHRLMQLIQQIQDHSNHQIIIVDDGSEEKYRLSFSQAAELGCTVLTHQHNQGKGAALKTAFSYLLEQQCQDDFICADCDGQHTWTDIKKLAEVIPCHPDKIILGSRNFLGKVPFKSRFGNSATRLIFSLLTGTKISDTQTGLRGFSATMLPWLVSITGNRYEYEMKQLLEAKKAGYGFYSIPIETVYEDNNSGSHFHPFRDSIRVYLPMIKFSAASISCGLLDFILLFLFKGFTDNLLYSVVLARVISSLCNYLLNKHLVFDAKEGRKLPSLLQYYLLAVVILCCNYLLLHLFHEILQISLFYSKLLTETLLFLVSYTIQHRFIFKK